WLLSPVARAPRPAATMTTAVLSVFGKRDVLPQRPGKLIEQNGLGMNVQFPECLRTHSPATQATCLRNIQMRCTPCRIDYCAGSECGMASIKAGQAVPRCRQ